MNNRETTKIHTRLLRATLLEEHSQSFWKHFKQDETEDNVETAYNNYWFGSANKATIRRTLSNFYVRYTEFPNCLSVLKKWTDIDIRERILICHWHLQLSDVLYRKFTSEFIPSRFIYTPAAFHKDQVQQWVYGFMGEKWAGSTQAQLASKMLSCIRSVGYVSKDTTNTIELRYPSVNQRALQYILYALREIEFQGSLLENPYLKSVGLTGSFLISQINQTSTISVNQLGDVTSLEWKYPTLLEWSNQEISGGHNGG